MKHSPLPAAAHWPRLPGLAILAAFALVLLALAGIGCRKVAQPQGWAAPSEADGLLVVAHKDKLYALDAQTLTPRWAFPTEAEQGGSTIKPVALYGTPAVAGGTVFVPTYAGSLYALDVSTGKLRWQTPFDTKGPLVGGVAVSQDTVYFGSSDGQVYAVDVQSGKERWSHKTGRSIWSTPVLVGSTLYVTSLDGKLYALDTAQGAEQWSFTTDAGIAAAPLVDQAGGLVYVAGFDSQLRAIDLKTHEQRWSLKAGNWFWSEPALSGGVIYAASLDSQVYAVDAATGAERWAKPFSTDAPVRAALSVVGQNLLVIDGNGGVYALDPATGTPRAGTPLAIGGDVPADPLVVVGAAGASDVMLLVTTGGELVRVDPAQLRVIDRKPLSGS